MRKTLQERLNEASNQGFAEGCRLTEQTFAVNAKKRELEDARLRSLTNFVEEAARMAAANAELAHSIAELTRNFTTKGW